MHVTNHLSILDDTARLRLLAHMRKSGMPRDARVARATEIVLLPADRSIALTREEHQVAFPDYEDTYFN